MQFLIYLVIFVAFLTTQFVIISKYRRMIGGLALMFVAAIYSFLTGMKYGRDDLANVLSRQLPQAANLLIQSSQKPALHEKTLIRFGEEAAVPTNIEKFDRVLSSLQALLEE